MGRPRRRLGAGAAARPRRAVKKSAETDAPLDAGGGQSPASRARPAPAASALLLAISLAVTAVAFSGVLGHGFTNWDDDRYVINNRTIRTLDPGTVRAVFSGPFDGTYSPLVMLSFAVDYHLSGLNPGTFHLTNLILHLANTALVFWMVMLWDRRAVTAFVTSLAFGVHPLHVEPVAWITARKDLLYAFFFLISMVAYCRFLSARHRSRAYMVSFVAFVLAALSKVVAVTAPVVFLLFDAVSGRRDLRKMLIEKAPFLAVAVPLGVVNVLAQRAVGASEAAHAFTLIDRMMMSSYLLIFYSVKTVAPLGLSALYMYPGVTGRHLPLEFLVAPVAVVLVLAGFWFVARRSRVVLLGGGFFLINILPVLQIVPVGIALAADRFAYLPMVGILFLFGVAVSSLGARMSEHGWPKRALVGGVILIGLALAVASSRRAEVWRDSLALWNSVLAVDPACPVALGNRGSALIDRQDYEGARADLEHARALAPGFAPIYWGLGEIAGNEGQFDRAVRLFSEAIRLDPGYAAAYYKRGVALYWMKRYPEAFDDVTRASSLGYQVHPDLMARLRSLQDGARRPDPGH